MKFKYQIIFVVFISSILIANNRNTGEKSNIKPEYHPAIVKKNRTIEKKDVSYAAVSLTNKKATKNDSYHSEVSETGKKFNEKKDQIDAQNSISTIKKQGLITEDQDKGSKSIKTGLIIHHEGIIANETDAVNDENLPNIQSEENAIVENNNSSDNAIPPAEPFSTFEKSNSTVEQQETIFYDQTELLADNYASPDIFEVSDDIENHFSEKLLKKNIINSSILNSLKNKKIDITPELKIPVEPISDQLFMLPKNGLISFEASYVTDNAYNFSGGLSRGFTHMGMIDLAASISTARAGLWKGGQFYLQIETTYGGKATADYTGNLQVFSNIENGNYTYLYQMLYIQNFKDIQVTMGVHDLNSEFVVSDFAGEYINNSFSIMPTLSMNVPVSIFPKPVLGGIIKYTPKNDFSIHAGIYDGEPLDLDLEPYNTLFKSNEEPSLFSIGEIAIGLGNSEKYSGSLKFGGYYHNGDFVDMRNQEKSIKGNSGAYIILDQMFSGFKEDRKIGTFAKFGFTNEDRNEFPVFWGLGVNYYSPFSNRPDDLIGVAVGKMGINRSLIGYDLAYQHDNEAVIECMYKVKIDDNIMIQPEIQLIVNPGAQASIQNALVGMVRAGISF